jgi:hypothetical protein
VPLVADSVPSWAKSSSLILTRLLCIKVPSLPPMVQMTIKLSAFQPRGRANRTKFKTATAQKKSQNSKRKSACQDKYFPFIYLEMNFFFDFKTVRRLGDAGFERLLCILTGLRCG